MYSSELMVKARVPAGSGMCHIIYTEAHLTRTKHFEVELMPESSSNKWYWLINEWEIWFLNRWRGDLFFQEGGNWKEGCRWNYKVEKVGLLLHFDVIFDRAPNFHLELCLELINYWIIKPSRCPPNTSYQFPKPRRWIMKLEYCWPVRLPPYTSAYTPPHT